MKSSRTCSLTVASLLLAMLALSPRVAATPADAGAAEEAIAWEAICAVSVCRGTGHDGAFGARLSPDGQHVAVAVVTAGRRGIDRVAVADASAQPWTEGHSPVWLADGNGIVFVNGADLWRISLEEEAPTRLTDDEHDVRAPRPSPDGRWVVFASGRSGHQDLWLVPSDGGAPPRQLTHEAMPLEEARFGHAWSPDGNRIAYFSNRGDADSDDLWLIEVDTGEARQVSRGFMGQSEPSWSPDGQRIAAYGVAKSDFWYSDLSDVFIVEPGSDREWAVEMQAHARDTGAPAWSEDGSALYFPRHERGAVDLWQVPSAGGVATRVTHGGGQVHDWHVGPGDSGLVLVRSTPTRGREVDHLPLAGGALRQLTQVASDWPGVVAPEEISYRTRDGMYVQAFMFLPPGFDPGKRYPTLVQVHGGGTHSYYNGLNLVEQRLAQRGYVVLAVNYRGGSGFGREFQDLGIGDWANTQALDAADAAHFARAQAWSNGRVGIYGYSYGGIISLGAVARDPDAFDAAVPMGGIYDFADAYATADRLGRLFTAAGHRGAPDESPDAYAASDTIARLDQVRTPVLLMHGEADVRAPYRQFQQASAALQRHGKVFQAHSYADEPHQFLDPANRVDMYQRLEAWMDQWLKTEEPSGDPSPANRSQSR